MTAAVEITWGRSARDGRRHAWTAERWCGDAIALCQHACHATRVDCVGDGETCSPCTELARSP